VATCITKTESTHLAGAQEFDETPVKQPLACTSTSGSGVDVSQPSLVQEAGKQTDSSSADVHDQSLISLHEDDRLSSLSTRDAQRQDTRNQSAEVRQHAGLDSATTWSNNCVDLRSSLTEGASGSAGSSQFTEFTHC